MFYVFHWIIFVALLAHIYYSPYDFWVGHLGSYGSFVYMFLFLLTFKLFPGIFSPIAGSTGSGGSGGSSSGSSSESDSGSGSPSKGGPSDYSPGPVESAPGSHHDGTHGPGDGDGGAGGD